AVFAEPLRLAKTDSLAHEREVVSGAAVSQSFAILKKEERGSARAKDTVAFRPIGPEPLSCTERYRCQTALTILRPPDREHGFIEIDVFLVEPERLVHPKASDSDQPEQGRTGPCAQSKWRGKLPGLGHDRGDLIVGIDVGPRPARSAGYRAGRRNLAARVEA